MANNTQFSIAVHIVAGLGFGCGKDMTSGKLAMSVNTSPSFVRRILAKLSKAGLIETTTGKTGSCKLAKKPEQISLLDVYKAVDAPKVFSIHTYPAQKPCLVSCNIKKALENVLEKTQHATEASLAKMTLAEIMKDIGQK
jgi:Rrf2 family protein